MTEPEVTSVTRKDIMVTIVHPDDTLKRQVVYSDLISSIIPAGYNKIQQMYRKVSDSKIYIIYTDSDDVEQTVSFTPGAGGGDMTKAEYDSDDDGVILKAQLDSDLANTSGTNTGDQTLAGLGCVAHSLATAINDFLVASGAGAFVKKTLAEVKTLLDWAADIATHAALATGIHGVGASTVESVSGSQDKVDTHAGAADHHTGYVLESLFDAQTILQATSDNTPAALTVGEQTVVGRITGGNIVALTVAQLQTLLFSAALPENLDIQWDDVLSADGKYSGIVTKQFLGGATIAFGEVVYLAAADSRWELAKADAAATSFGMVGICVLATTDGAACTVLLLGKVRADAKFPAFTIGAPVFISAATAGLLTSTAPTGTTNFVVRIVAQALTADEISFRPDSTYIELA